jgi:hypothetical protein
MSARVLRGECVPSRRSAPQSAKSGPPRFGPRLQSLAEPPPSFFMGPKLRANGAPRRLPRNEGGILASSQNRLSSKGYLWRSCGRFGGESALTSVARYTFGHETAAAPRS